MLTGFDWRVDFLWHAGSTDGAAHSHHGMIFDRGCVWIADWNQHAVIQYDIKERQEKSRWPWVRHPAGITQWRWYYIILDGIDQSITLVDKDTLRVVTKFGEWGSPTESPHGSPYQFNGASTLCVTEGGLLFCKNDHWDHVQVFQL